MDVGEGAAGVDVTGMVVLEGSVTGAGTAGEMLQAVRTRAASRATRYRHALGLITAPSFDAATADSTGATQSGCDSIPELLQLRRIVGESMKAVKLN